MEKWRIKKDGNPKMVEGKTYHWCPHYELDGIFDRLYVTHNPGEGHQKWLENETKMKEKQKNNKSGRTLFAFFENPFPTQ